MATGPLNTVLIGNPGAGKSTILNSLSGSIQFPSGISYGRGLTVEERSYTNTTGTETYIDTPGLADPDLRLVAAEAIGRALTRNGHYRIVFVVTLEAMRFRAVDGVTIETVLNACPTIGSNYAIIINKIKKSKVEELKDNLAVVTAKVFQRPGIPSTPWVFINEADPALEDEDDVFKEPSADLIAFLNLMPKISISPADVKTVDAADMEARSAELEQVMADMEKDDMAMERQVAQQKHEFQQQLAAAEIASAQSLAASALVQQKEESELPDAVNEEVAQQRRDFEAWFQKQKVEMAEMLQLQRVEMEAGLQQKRDEFEARMQQQAQTSAASQVSPTAATSAQHGRFRLLSPETIVLVLGFVPLFRGLR